MLLFLKNVTRLGALILKKEKTVRFGVSLAEVLLKNFDRLIFEKKYQNRSKAIGDLIQEKIIEESQSAPRIVAYGVVAMIYDQAQRDLNDKLTHYQHHHFRQVISNLHIHLDHENCLEIIVLKGQNRALKSFADSLAAIRGVKFVKLLPVIAKKGVS